MLRLLFIAGALGLGACDGSRGVGFGHYDTTSMSAPTAADIQAEYEALLVQRGMKIPVVVVEQEEVRAAETGT